jgi:tetratricopeptide (TPR) repeat protein
LAVLGSALAIGAIHVVSTLILAGFILVLFVVGLATRTVGSRLPAPAVVAAALGAFSLVQSLPLPAALLQHLAPANVELWRGTYELLGRASPRWLPLSLDPGASLLEGLKWLTYAAAFALATTVARRRGGQVAALIVWGSALITAGVTLLHRLAGADAVFGWYAPVGEFSRSSLGPLLNANNLAGYLNLGVFCGIGLLLAPNPLVPRWAAGLGAAPLIGVAVETGSRGGLVSLALGLVLVAAVLGGSRSLLLRSHVEKRRMILAVVGVAGFGLTLAILSSSHRLASNVADKSLSKLAMAGWVRPLVEDYSWLGVGRGAFESAFQSYRIGKNNLIYSHPENIVVQWVAEWGIPVGLAGLFALAWLLRPRRLGVSRSALALGVFAALVVVFVQNLVDLGLEIPAVALAVVVAVGGCYGAARSESTEPMGRRAPKLGWWLAGLAGVALVAAIWVSPTPVGAERREQELSEKSLTAADSKSVSAFRAGLARAMLAHPAEPYFPRLGGLVAFRAHDQPPLPWIDRALTLGLTSGRTHYLLASVLASWQKNAQALMELRFAVTYDPELTGPVATAALKLSSEATMLERAAPSGEAGVGVLLAMANKLRDEPERQKLRFALLRYAVERATTKSDAHAELGRALYSELERGEQSPICAGALRADCLRDAQTEARTLQTLAPLDARGPELAARVLLLNGDAAGAERLLASACPKANNRRSCLLLWLKAAAATQSAKQMDTAARAILASGCGVSEDCAKLETEIGDVFMEQAAYGQALAHYKRAAREDPSSPLWLKLANAAERAGELPTAVEALTRVELKKRDPKLRRRIDELRLRALAPTAGP